MAEIRMEGIGEVLEGLNNLRTDKQMMNKQLKTIIRKVLADARKMISKDAKAVLPNDPRQAYRAVRHSVYRRIFGGQVNILARRRANNKMSIYHPPRTLRPGQRGGNRRPRSAETERMDGYYGSDRGFILRFVNAGTDERITCYGKRGRIKRRGWFADSSTKALNKAAEDLSILIDRAIAEVWTDWVNPK